MKLHECVRARGNGRTFKLTAHRHIAYDTHTHTQARKQSHTHTRHVSCMRYTQARLKQSGQAHKNGQKTTIIELNEKQISAQIIGHLDEIRVMRPDIRIRQLPPLSLSLLSFLPFPLAQSRIVLVAVAFHSCTSVAAEIYWQTVSGSLTANLLYFPQNILCLHCNSRNSATKLEKINKRAQTHINWIQSKFNHIRIHLYSVWCLLAHVRLPYYTYTHNILPERDHSRLMYYMYRYVLKFQTECEFKYVYMVVFFFRPSKWKKKQTKQSKKRPPVSAVAGIAAFSIVAAAGKRYRIDTQLFTVALIIHKRVAT